MKSNLSAFFRPILPAILPTILPAILLAIGLLLEIVPIPLDVGASGAVSIFGLLEIGFPGQPLLAEDKKTYLVKPPDKSKDLPLAGPYHGSFGTEANSASEPAQPPDPIAKTSLDAAIIIEPPGLEPASDAITINFENVDILSLLRYLSEETGKGFIISEGIHGTVTIISPVKLTKKEALALLESILQVKGYSAIPSGKMYKIVPLDVAKVAGTQTRVGSQLSSLGEDDVLVTQIVPLERTSVLEAQGILKPLLPNDTFTMAFTPSNTLVVTGRSINIKRALEILNELEKGMFKPGLDIVPLKFSAGAQIKSQLEQIIQGGGVERQEIKGGVTFITDLRSNSLFVISSPENFERIRALIARLDVGDTDSRPEMTRFFPLKFADEADTAQQIKEILGLGKNPGPDNASDSQAVETTRVVPIKRTRTIMVTTRSTELLKKIENLIVHLDKEPTNDSGDVRVIRVIHANAKTLAETMAQLQQNLETPNKKNPKKTVRLNFVADPDTNSIIMTGPPEDFPQYEKILKSLDIMRPQIMVEVLIAEISGSLAKNFGIEWNYIEPDKTHARAYGGTSFGLKSQALTGSGMQIGMIKDKLNLQDAVSGSIIELSKIKALMRMYQNNSEFNILSAPQILATDNEEAKITVGEVVALPQGFTKDRDSGRFDLTNFKYEDVGISLILTPRVNSNQVVSLKIDQEIKKRQEENLYEFNVPVLTKRRIETNITVPNHETIVIGGLMREDRTVVEDRVPGLANLPLIGKVFRNKRRSVQKTNLLVFLTPHILSNPQEVSQFDVSTGKMQPIISSQTAPISAKDQTEIEKKMEGIRRRAHDVFDSFQKTLPSQAKPKGSLQGR